MQWERAKTFIILFFVLLNVSLFAILRLENRRYILTLEQEQAIRTVLYRNNISLETAIMRDHAPMRSLSISGFYYDEDELIAMFFDNPETVLRLSEEPYLFTDGYSRLTISINGFIEFINPQGFTRVAGTARMQDTPVEQAEAEALSNAFIAQYFPDFRLDSVFPSDEGWRLYYRQVYRNYKIYTNIIQFLVTPIGIREIEMQFGRIEGFATGPPRIIVSPDEALLAFIQHARNVLGNVPVSIVDMDRAFFQENSSTQRGLTHHAIPVYRISVYGFDMPFLINAYTNEIIH